MPDAHRLDLETLSDFHEVLTPDLAGAHAEACATSFIEAGHSSGVCLKVDAEEDRHVVQVVWARSVGERQKKAHRDQKRRTDDASVALALGVVHTLMGYSGVEKSETRDRVDYYLSDNSSDDHLIFNHGPRLEVSGIFKPTSQNSLVRRARAKVKRLSQTGGPGYDGNTLVFVVEFASPSSILVRV